MMKRSGKYYFNKNINFFALYKILHLSMTCTNLHIKVNLNMYGPEAPAERAKMRGHPMYRIVPTD